MITISEVMIKTPKKIASSTSVVDAATRMRDERVGSLLVERNGEFVGMVTDTDVVRKAGCVGRWFCFSARRVHTRLVSGWNTDVCSSNLQLVGLEY